MGNWGVSLYTLGFMHEIYLRMLSQVISDVFRHTPQRRISAEGIHNLNTLI